MIDIYNEVAYVKDVLEKGISDNWKRETALLARYYKKSGMKKSEIKKLIKQECSAKGKKIYYDPIRHFRDIDSIVEREWKKDIPFRQIDKVEFSKEVLDWFMNLESSYVVSDDEVATLKTKRPKLTIKNQVINWQRTKYLFTLFIWTKIQENYLDTPDMHYLRKHTAKFRQDADLKKSFNLSHERNLMYDLGLLNVNFGLGIKAVFIENDVFKIPVTDENRITISGDDLYSCGYWLEKQKMGTFICQTCGKEIAHYSNSKQEKGRKYCKECLNHKNVIRTFTCVDCGEQVITSSLGTKACRCDDCNEVYKRKKQAEYKRIQRARAKNIAE